MSSGLIKVDLIESQSGSGITVQDINSLTFNSLPGSSIIQVFSKEVFKRQNLMAVTQTVITTPEFVLCAIDDVIYTRTASVSINLDIATYWASDKASYATPGNRIGKDIYLYACEPTSGTEFDYILTDNSTNPAGYTVDTSRKIAGFHTLCVSVGTTGECDLDGYVAGDIIPASVWDLFHRSASENAGMVYSENLRQWGDIYMGSSTSVLSIYGGTTLVSKDWMDFVDYYAAKNKRLMFDHEFQIFAAGSPEEHSYGASSPGTTGGNSNYSGYHETYNPDTKAQRRIISSLGCEDMTGVWWQCLLDQSYRGSLDGTAFDAAYTYKDETGGKGELYTQGLHGDVKLLAGGYWAGGAYCGSRSRHAAYSRWAAITYIGARGCAEPRVVHLD